MISSWFQGVSSSLVIVSVARQQVDASYALHGPVAGSRMLGYHPVAPICSKVIVPPSEGGSRSPGAKLAAPRPDPDAAESPPIPWVALSVAAASPPVGVVVAS